MKNDHVIRIPPPPSTCGLSIYIQDYSDIIEQTTNHISMVPNVFFCKMYVIVGALSFNAVLDRVMLV